MIATLGLYGTGGYIAQLKQTNNESKKVVRTLFDYEWMNKYTRAVFIETTMYNPNLNLIAIVVLMQEFPNFGGSIPRLEVYVTRLYRTLTITNKIGVLFDMIFFIYIFYSLFRELKELKRDGVKGYFQSVANWFDIIVILFGFLIMFQYIMTTIIRDNKILEYQANPNLFISYYQYALYQEALVYIIALIDFIAIIKLISFLKFDIYFFIIFKTMEQAAITMCWIVFYNSVWITGFMLCLHILLGDSAYNFNTLLRTLYSSYMLQLGVFEWDDFLDKEPLGPIFFIAYCVLVYFILLNLFIAALMEKFSSIRANKTLMENCDLNLVELIHTRLKTYLNRRQIRDSVSYPLSSDLRNLQDKCNIGTKKKKQKSKSFYHRDPGEMVDLRPLLKCSKNLSKIENFIERVFVEDFIEDTEILSLNFTEYPDEFHKINYIANLMYDELSLNDDLGDISETPSVEEGIIQDDTYSEDNDTSAVIKNSREFYRTKHLDSSVNSLPSISPRSCLKDRGIDVKHDKDINITLKTRTKSDKKRTEFRHYKPEVVQTSKKKFKEVISVETTSRVETNRFKYVNSSIRRYLRYTDEILLQSTLNNCKGAKGSTVVQSEYLSTHRYKSMYETKASDQNKCSREDQLNTDGEVVINNRHDKEPKVRNKTGRRDYDEGDEGSSQNDESSKTFTILSKLGTAENNTGDIESEFRNTVKSYLEKNVKTNTIVTERHKNSSVMRYMRHINMICSDSSSFDTMDNDEQVIPIKEILEGNEESPQDLTES